MFPAETYHQHIDRLNLQLASLKKRKNNIAWARLFTLIAGVAIPYYLFPVTGVIATVALALLFLAVYIRLVVLYVNNRLAMENMERLIRINRQELEIAAGHYTNRPPGNEWLPIVHEYAHDLDILGRASVFQFINRTTSEFGNRTLVNWLLMPADASDITKRQEAAKELGQQYEWRQQLQAYGMEEAITIKTGEDVLDWLGKKNTISNTVVWKLLRYVYPCISFALIVLFIIDILPGTWLTGLLVGLYAISSQVSKQLASYYDQLDKIVPEVSILRKSAALIEGQTFKSTCLNELQQHYTGGKEKASTAIATLKSILDKFDLHLNPMVYIPLNTLLLWDLQLVFQLEKWRTRQKANASHWFSSLGEMEAVCSIANLHFNHPGWTFPVLDTDNRATIHASQLGHPLIAAEKRINNSFSTTGGGQLALITGSNMAGKSTFLRSIGVNIVLAMTGAPVCAESMTVSPIRIISSMRVADNLEESTSTFYAELKKLKAIIDAVNQQENVYVLLDEILRGTNSLDRHTGSGALIRQLIQHQASGMLATHDVELAQMQKDFPANIHNYHFDVQVAGEELYFDYKLKEGICQSLNASILMKKIGIEL